MIFFFYYSCQSLMRFVFCQNCSSCCRLLCSYCILSFYAVLLNSPQPISVKRDEFVVIYPLNILSVLMHCRVYNWFVLFYTSISNKGSAQLWCYALFFLLKNLHSCTIALPGNFSVLSMLHLTIYCLWMIHLLCVVRFHSIFITL